MNPVGCGGHPQLCNRCPPVCSLRCALMLQLFTSTARALCVVVATLFVCIAVYHATTSSAAATHAAVATRRAKHCDHINSICQPRAHRVHVHMCAELRSVMMIAAVQRRRLHSGTTQRNVGLCMLSSARRVFTADPHDMRPQQQHRRCVGIVRAHCVV